MHARISETSLSPLHIEDSLVEGSEFELAVPIAKLPGQARVSFRFREGRFLRFFHLWLGDYPDPRESGAL